MIARLWHGRTPAEVADEYVDYIRATGLPLCRNAAGNRGVHLMLRTEGDVTHFHLLSLWDSMDSVRAFARPDHEQAVYFPEDERFLLELEPTVVHYDVVQD